ncbi:MAG: hypothetical protein CVU38_12835 [Chloroflexi bacterium HGW-Chloroflexi-1]|nr:MAG: hypothetical protein CVU38_12835 [Chloroflexi bacterium HGW-Chloroflexi-1]
MSVFPHAGEAVSSSGPSKNTWPWRSNWLPWTKQPAPGPTRTTLICGQPKTSTAGSKNCAVRGDNQEPQPMASYLLDSGLVIRHLRGRRWVVRLLRGLGKMGRLAISAVTRLEIHAGMAADEEYATQKLLSRFVTCDPDRNTADRAGDYIRESRSKGVTLSVPDAIIAATAVSHNVTLVTLNQAHFEGISGLRIEPLPEDE